MSAQLLAKQASLVAIILQADKAHKFTSYCTMLLSQHEDPDRKRFLFDHFHACGLVEDFFQKIDISIHTVSADSKTVKSLQKTFIRKNLSAKTVGVVQIIYFYYGAPFCMQVFCEFSNCLKKRSSCDIFRSPTQRKPTFINVS